MKRGTPRHPKVAELASLLNLPKYSVVGLLEMLWHFAAEFALDGAVGKFSNEAISEALCYDGASIDLINALLASRWLDACPCHRLRVHDWPSHADQTVKRVLDKRNQAFIECYDDPSTTLEPSKMPLPLPLPKANTKTNTTHPRAKKKSHVYDQGFEKFWEHYPRKEGKAKAEIAWKKVDVENEVLIEAIEKMKATIWKDKDMDFICHAATWLNGRRWEDEIPKPQPSAHYSPSQDLDELEAREREMEQGR